MKDADINLTKFLVLTLILLIIGIIVYPIYSITKKEKQKENFEKNVNNIITTAKEYYSNNKQFDKENLVFTIQDGKFIEDGLNYNGQLPDSGSILINNNGDVQIVASDSNWCATKRYTDDILNVEEYSNSCKVADKISLGNIDIALSTSEDGLYQEGQNYYYRGANPNNYIEIEGTMFRIVSIDQNKNIEIILNDILYNRTWNITSLTNNKYNILEEDNLAYYLNYSETSDEKFNKLRKNSSVFEYNWINNKIDYSDNKLYSELKQEESGKSLTAVVGLLSALEYIRASSNSNCISDSLRNNECGINNYLNISQNYFTMSNSNDLVWAVSNDGKLYETNLNIKLGVRPVMVLSNNIKLSGKGTKDLPYKMVSD